MKTSPLVARTLQTAFIIITSAMGLCSCGPSIHSSSVKVWGGTITTDPRILSILSNGNCTASVIGSNTLITAAHCGNPQFIAIDSLGIRIAKPKAVIAKDNLLGNGFVSKLYGNIPGLVDIAFIIFDGHPFDNIEALKLNRAPVHIDDSVTVSGYGCYTKLSDLKGAAADGKLRSTSFKIAGFTRDKVGICTAAKTSGVLNGDSGSPLLNGNEIVGITSFVEHPQPSPAATGCEIDEPVADVFAALSYEPVALLVQAAQDAGAEIPSVD